MVDDRWTRIISTPARVEGNWQVLPENGLGALIAFAAGPGRARPHLSAQIDRHVKVQVSDGVQTQEWAEPMTDADAAAIASAIREYLADSGVQAPDETWWEVDLPGSLTAEKLIARLHERLESIKFSGTPEERARLEARLIMSTVSGLYASS